MSGIKIIKISKKGNDFKIDLENHFYLDRFIVRCLVIADPTRLIACTNKDYRVYIIDLET